MSPNFVILFAVLLCGWTFLSLLGGERARRIIEIKAAGDRTPEETPPGAKQTLGSSKPSSAPASKPPAAKSVH